MRAKLLVFDWLSARARHLHFESALKRKADFELNFELIASEFKFNRVGWQKWHGNRVIAPREIPGGEPECFRGNSKWLFVFKLSKTLVINRRSFATQVNLFT